MQFDLVFEGGGAKGLLFVGAMEALEANEVAHGRLMGTSAGAITATFLAAGYTRSEVQAALDETTEDGRPVFETFLGDPAPFSEEELENSEVKGFLTAVDVPLVPDLFEQRLDEKILTIMSTNPRLINLLNFIERGGWYSADNFLAWICKYRDRGKFKGKPRRFSEMSMQEFCAATECDLTLIAADTTGASMLVLNHRTAPDLPVAWATRMSMSVPLLWEEVIWRPEWGAYRGRDISGHAIVDGGLLSNFPIELFISNAPQVTAVMGEKKTEDVIGFLIDESLPVKDAPPEVAGAEIAGGIDLGTFETVRRIHQLINTVTQAHDKAVIEAFEKLVVRLPARGYGTTEFDMSPERKRALITAGREVTADYLIQRIAIAQGIAGDVDFGVEFEDPAAIADRHALQLLDE